MELLEQPAGLTPSASDAQLDAAYRTLDRVLGSVVQADNKALIALTFQGAIVAGLALIASTLTGAIAHFGPWQVATMIALGAFFVCLCTSTLKLFQTISPRIAPAHGPGHVSELFYFAGIANMAHADFFERSQVLSRVQIQEAISAITHVNARIAMQKFENLRAAYYGLGLQIILYIVVVLLSVIPHSR